MTDQWFTSAEIDAARDRFERAIPGWQRPAAWAIGRISGGDTTLFERINIGEAYLPAVVLATVTGHVSGSGSYQLTATDLDRAIEMLEPAEACVEMEQANLRIMRDLRADMAAGDGAAGDGADAGDAVVVFVGDLADRGDDQGVRSLLDLLSLNHR